MIEVSPAWSRPAPTPAAARDLTYAETADLDRLRSVLASACDRTDPRAISWLWDSMVSAHPGPAPAGFVEAIATALGDLLAVHVARVRWRVWPGPAGPTLGVASEVRPQAPVVPFLDAHDRWNAHARDWMSEYLSRAAAHLSGATVPQPRRAPDDPAAHLDAEAAVFAVDDEGAPPYEPMTADPVPSSLALPTRVAAPVAAVPTIALPDPAVPPDLLSPAGQQLVAPATAPHVPVTLLTRAAEAFTGPVLPPGAELPPAPAAAPVVPLPARVPVATAAPALTGPAPIDWTVPPAPEATDRTALATTVAPPPPDTGVEDFALDALEHAMALLRDTGAFDREVLVMLLDAHGHRRTESCPGDPGEARFRARELVRTSGAARAAITFVDRDPVDLPGPRQAFPAVVVDAWAAGTAGVRVGRRFVDDVLGTGPLGPPLVVGHIARLL